MELANQVGLKLANSSLDGISNPDGARNLRLLELREPARKEPEAGVSQLFLQPMVNQLRGPEREDGVNLPTQDLMVNLEPKVPEPKDGEPVELELKGPALKVGELGAPVEQELEDGEPEEQELAEPEPKGLEDGANPLNLLRVLELKDGEPVELGPRGLALKGGELEVLVELVELELEDGDSLLSLHKGLGLKDGELEVLVELEPKVPEPGVLRALEASELVEQELKALELGVLKGPVESASAEPEELVSALELAKVSTLRVSSMKQDPMCSTLPWTTTTF